MQAGGRRFDPVILHQSYRSCQSYQPCQDNQAGSVGAKAPVWQGSQGAVIVNRDAVLITQGSTPSARLVRQAGSFCIESSDSSSQVPSGAWLKYYLVL